MEENKDSRENEIAASEKLITYTMDKGNGEQNLMGLNMKDIACEIEAEAEYYFANVDEEDNDYFEVTIRVEKKMTQQEIENLPDYTG